MNQLTVMLGVLAQGIAQDLVAGGAKGLAITPLGKTEMLDQVDNTLSEVLQERRCGRLQVAAPFFSLRRRKNLA